MILHSSSFSDSMSFTSISFSRFNQYQFRILILSDHTNNEFKRSNHRFFILFQLISLSFIFTHIVFTNHCSFHSSIDYPQIRFHRLLAVSFSHYDICQYSLSSFFVSLIMLDDVKNTIIGYSSAFWFELIKNKCY